MLDQSDPRRVIQMDLQALARDAQPLKSLPMPQVNRRILSGEVRQFPGECLLLGEGSQIEEVYLILRGMVTVGVYQEQAPALWLYVSGPGTMVDMCALLDPPVSPVSIRALSDVEVLAIPRTDFVEVMRQEPAVWAVESQEVV